MPRSEQKHLGSEVAQIKRAIKDLQSGRLQNASMHGTRLYIYDDEGDIREVIGNQGDGSYGSRVIQSPHQPTPTAPILTAGELGSVMAEWDGGIVQGRVPVVHGHLKVLALFLGEDGQWDPDEARLVSSIRDRDGGATTLALGTTGRWGVAFQMVGADRVTLGAVSAPSEITVTALVDTEEIEAELEAARQERQEYRDAFDERTGEYDRLMSEQEDALAESDAWSHTALYRADSAAAESAAARVEASDAAGVAQDAQAKYEAVSSRQDASEAEIEAARQEAAAAHEAAGEAHQYAASIADQVDGIGKTIRSTNPPSGTASEGDYWRQFDSMSRDRRLVGWWEYRDGAWDRLSLDVTVLPMAEIGQLVVDDARAQRIFAETAEVERLAVGDFENLLPESMLWEYRDQGLSSVSWQAISGGASGWTTTTNRGQHPIRLRWQGSEYVSSTSRLAYGGRDGQGIPVKPGDQFHLSMVGWNGTSGLSVGVRYGEDDLSFVARETAFDITSDSPSGSWVVPDGTSIRRMQIEFTGDSSAAGGNADFGDIELRRVQAGELTVDGLLSATEGTINRLFTDTMVATSVWSQIVRTRLLEADEALIGGALIQDDAITVDHIAVTESLIFEIAQGIRLEVDQLASNDIVGMSIRGGLIEGAQFQTHSEANRGVTINSDGSMEIRPGDGGDRTFWADPSGNVEIAGQFTAMGGGQEIRLENSPHYNRPQITLDTGSSDDSQPNIFVATESESSYGTGAFVLSGREETRNSSGRMDLVLGDGQVGYGGIYRQFGSFAGVGFRLQGEPNRSTLAVRGRMVDSSAHHSRDAFLAGLAPSFNDLAPGGSMSMSFTYGQPAVSGIRRVQVTAELETNPPGSGQRGIIASISDYSSSGFTSVEYNAGSASVGSRVHYIAVNV